VEFESIRKPSPATEELTLTERLFTVGREPDADLPDRRLVPDQSTADPAATSPPTPSADRTD